MVVMGIVVVTSQRQGCDPPQDPDSGRRRHFENHRLLGVVRERGLPMCARSVETGMWSGYMTGNS